eukprot:7380487-Prymnesium_polylepis.1
MTRAIERQSNGDVTLSPRTSSARSTWLSVPSSDTFLKCGGSRALHISAKRTISSRGSRVSSASSAHS